MAAGRKTGGGSRKGKPNKTTKATKEALELAFDGLDGVPGLIEWARENKTEFYKLWAKLLPLEVKAEHSGDMQMNITLKRYSNAGN